MQCFKKIKNQTLDKICDISLVVGDIRETAKRGGSDTTVDSRTVDSVTPWTSARVNEPTQAIPKRNATRDKERNITTKL